MIGKGGLVAFLWCRVTVFVLLPFLTAPWVGLQCVIMIIITLFVEKKNVKT